MFPEHVETERLHLRRFDAAVDLWEAYDFFDRGRVSEEAFEHLNFEPHDTPKETFDRMREGRDKWEDAEAATYAIYPTDEEDGGGELAGRTSLTPQWEKRSAYFGIRLRKSYWGRGYSGERAAALAKVAFDRLDLEVVSAGHVPGNDRSRRAIEKYVDRFGGGKDGVLRNWLVDDGDVRDLHVYTITREQFERTRPDDLGVEIHDGSATATASERGGDRP